MSNQWADYVQNPKSFVLKRYAAQLLQDKYGYHETILERLSHHLVTTQDLEQMGKLMVELYELGYLKAVDDHKQALAKAGFKATITLQNAAASPKESPQR